MGHRFFVPPGDMKEGKIAFRESGDQIRKVLRLRPDQEVEAFDGAGGRYRVRLQKVNKGEVTGVVVETFPTEPPPGLEIVLAQGLAKGAKMDLVIQKGTELGVTHFAPLKMARSVVKVDEEGGEKKGARWRKIALEAAEQSGRAYLPQVSSPRTLKEFCEEEKDCGLKLLLWEEERESGLRDLFREVEEPERVAVVIGPEGGITAVEVEEARRCGFRAVGLGGNILRTETAVLAIASILQYHYGNLGKRPFPGR